MTPRLLNDEALALSGTVELLNAGIHVQVPVGTSTASVQLSPRAEVTLSFLLFLEQYGLVVAQELKEGYLDFGLARSPIGKRLVQLFSLGDLETIGGSVSEPVEPPHVIDDADLAAESATGFSPDVPLTHTVTITVPHTYTFHVDGSPVVTETVPTDMGARVTFKSSGAFTVRLIYNLKIVARVYSVQTRPAFLV